MGAWDELGLGSLSKELGLDRESINREIIGGSNISSDNDVMKRMAKNWNTRDEGDSDDSDDDDVMKRMTKNWNTKKEDNDNSW